MVGWQWGSGSAFFSLSVFLFCHLDLDLPLDLSLNKQPLLLPLSLFRLSEIEWFWFYGCCYIIYESHDNAPPSGINIKENGKPVTGTLFSIYSWMEFFVYNEKMKNIFIEFPLLLFDVWFTPPPPNFKPKPHPLCFVAILKSLAMAFQLWSKFINFTISPNVHLIWFVNWFYGFSLNFVVGICYYIHYTYMYIFRCQSRHRWRLLYWHWFFDFRSAYCFHLFYQIEFTDCVTYHLCIMWIV